MAPPDDYEPPRGVGEEERIRAGLDRLDALLQQNPHLAERTMRYLAGDLPDGDDTMPRKKGQHMVPLNIRLTDDLIERMDNLIEYGEGLHHVAAGGLVTRSTVHRLVVLAGLEALEAQAAGRAKGATRQSQRLDERKLARNLEAGVDKHKAAEKRRRDRVQGKP